MTADAPTGHTSPADRVEPLTAASRGLRAVLPDLSPWRASADFRRLWLSGLISNFGSFLTFVALPVQLKDLTGSAAAVGAIGAVELLPLMVFGALTVAGGCDMVSGIFRRVMWNQTIPDELRGRLAGIELLSYSVGPTLGQVRSGATAAWLGVRTSVWSGGLLCAGAVGLLALGLPKLMTYDARTNEHAVRLREQRNPAPPAEPGAPPLITHR